MIDPSSFREAIRTVSVSYPIPFLFATLLAFAVCCMGGAVAATDVLRWLFAGVSVIAALIAFALAIYAVLHKPELLRSEHYTLVSRYFDMLGDVEMPQSARDAAGRTILGVAEENTAKKAAIRGNEADSHSGEEGHV